jgi:hypothetical protein
MPVIQRDSSGGWTWTRPTGSPSCSASQALAGRTARAAWVSARTSSSVIAPLPYQVVEGGGRVGLAQPRDQREAVRRTPGLAQRAGLDMLVTAGRQPGRAAVGPGGHERRRASLGEFSPGRQQPVQTLPAAAHRAVDLVDRVPDDPGHRRASDISRPPPHGATALPRFATHYTVPGNDH